VSIPAAAIVGVGLAGDNHLRALSALGIPIAGVLASRPERTAAAASRWRTRPYPSLRELLADDAVGIVHVCVPPAAHRSLVEAAATAGRAVLCEKPLGTSRVEASAMAEAAARASVPAWVGFNRRFDSGVQLLREALAGGELGEPVNVWGSYQQQWNAEPSSFDWRFDPAVIGRTRVVGDIGAHWFDLAYHVLGSPLRRVCGLVTDPRGEREFLPGGGHGPQRMVPTNEDAFAALLQYENGVSGSVFGTQLAHGSWDDIVLRIDGSRRSAWWDSRHPSQMTIASKLEGTRTANVDSPSRSFESMLEEIYGLASTRIAATFADGVQDCAAIDAVLDSARTSGGWLNVEPSPSRATADVA
jgi:predicted dehydrogenase